MKHGRAVFLLTALVACGRHGGDLGQPDGASADAPLADATTDATPDGPPPDGPPPDAPADGCPHRTAAPGVPDHSYPPDQVHLGNVTVTDQNGVDALAGIRVIAGDLSVGGSLLSISLPDLEVVEGALLINTGNVANVELPRLETVGGVLNVSVGPTQTPLTTWHTPRWESIGSWFQVKAQDVDVSCFALAAGFDGAFDGVQNDPFVLPKLVTAADLLLEEIGAHDVSVPVMNGGVLELGESPAVRTLSVGTPKTVSASFVNALTTITVAPQTAMDSLLCRNCPALVDLGSFAGVGHVGFILLEQVPALSTLPTTTLVRSLHVANAPLLTDLSPLEASALTDDVFIAGTGASDIVFPNVTALNGDEGLVIAGNPSLTHLAFPALTSLDAADHRIVSNPKLPTCQAQAIRDNAIIAPGGTFTISGNGAGTCP